MKNIFIGAILLVLEVNSFCPNKNPSFSKGDCPNSRSTKKAFGKLFAMIYSISCQLGNELFSQKSIPLISLDPIGEICHIRIFNM